MWILGGIILVSFYFFIVLFNFIFSRNRSARIKPDAENDTEGNDIMTVTEKTAMQADAQSNLIGNDHELE